MRFTELAPLAPGNPLGLWPKQVELARAVRQAMDAGERLVIERAPLFGKATALKAAWSREILPPTILPEIDIQRPLAGDDDAAFPKIVNHPRPFRKSRGGRRKGKT